MSDTFGLKAITACSTLHQNLEEVGQVKTSADLKCLSILTTDGYLRIVCLNVQRSVIINQDPIKSFHWHAGKDYNKLATLTEDDKIVFYSINLSPQFDINDVKRFDSVCTLSELNNLIFESGNQDNGHDTCILDYRNEVATFVYRNHIAFLRSESDKKLQWEIVIKMSTDRCSLVSKNGVQIIRPYVFVFRNNGIIDVHELASRTLRTTIDLKEYSLESNSAFMPQFSSLSRYSVASNLEYLVHVDQEGRAYHHNLKHLLSQMQIDSLPTSMTSILKKSLRKPLSGFNRNANRENVNSFSVVKSLDYKSQLVREFKATPTFILFWDFDQESNGKIYVIDVETLTLHASLCFKEPSFVIFSENNHLPHLIMFPDKLSILMANESAGDFLSQLMMKEPTSAVAAHLAQLNGWKSILISTIVLKQSLKDRQIDATAFYLKNHEFDYTIVENFSSNEIEHMRSILQLLKSSIQESVDDASVAQYTEKLLNITFGYLIGFLKTAVSANNDTILNLVMDNLNDLRSLLENYPKLMSLRTDCDPASNDGTEIWKDWLHLDRLNIIRSGLQNKCLPLVQIFFLHNSYGNFNFSVHENSWSDLQPVVDLLNKNEFEKGIDTLKNMGFDVATKLKYIYFNSSIRHVRKAIEDYFVNQEWLTESDEQIIQRIHHLENVYPCQSIMTTLSMIKNLKLWENVDLLFLSKLFGYSKSITKLSHLDEKRDQTVVNEVISSFNYSCASISWISNWNDNTWQKVLLEALVSTPDVKYSDVIGSQLTWNYLIDHNRYDIISEWLRFVLESNFLGDCSINYYLNGKLTKEMIAEVTKLVPHSTAVILDQLSRSGIFSQLELERFPSLLKRLGRNASYGNDIVNILSFSSDLSIDDFHRQFIEYCTQHNLPSALWNHLEIFGLSLSFLFKDSINSACGWLPVITHFKNWADFPEDINCVNLASSANAEFKLQTELNATDIYKCGLIGLASLLFRSEPLRAILESDLEYLNCELVSPFFHDKNEWKFIFDVLSSYVKVNPKPIQNVTVYNLLKGNWPLDVFRLFGWQSSNNLKAPDCFKDLAHFAQVDLVRSYGLCQDLDYTFYLHQARPLFACVKFVSSTALTFEKLKQSLWADACNVAHHIAIENFDSKPVTASCVVFMELLKCNTHGLRIDLEVLQLIQWSQMKNMSSIAANQSRGENTELAVLLKSGFYDREDNLRLILKWAEQSMTEYLSETEVDGITELCYWSVINLFCQRHGLSYSEVFLGKCLEAGNWIMFISFAEMFYYSRNQVKRLLAQYGRDELAHHLKNAFYQGRNHSLPVVLEKSNTQTSTSSRIELFSKLGMNFNIRDDDTVMTQNLDKAVDCINNENSSMMMDKSSTSSSLSNDSTCEVPASLTPKDTLETILDLHKLALPNEYLLSRAIEYSNPTLAIIAACYRESSLIDCMAVWFLVNVDSDMQARIQSKLGNRSMIRAWNLRWLGCVIQLFIENDMFSMLSLGFYYFMPDSPHYFLFKFIKHFLEDKNYDETSLIYLKEFESQLRKIQSLENVAINLDISLEDFFVSTINYVLLHIRNQHERTLFLSALSQYNIEDALKSKGERVPSYSLLHSFEKLLSKTSVKYNILTLLNAEYGQGSHQEFRAILNGLLKEKEFTVADRFVELVGYPKSEILLTKANMEIASKIQFRPEYNVKSRLLVWKQYYLHFKTSNVSAKETCLFLKKYGLLAEDLLERYSLFYLAWCTFTWSEHQPWFDGEVEKEMWLARIKAEEESLELPDSLFDLVQDCKNQFKTSQQVFIQVHANRIAKCLLINSAKEKSVLEKVIDHELDQGNVDVAYRLTLLFDIRHLSWKIILTCMQLAEGAITEEQIDSDLMVLVAEHSALKSKSRLSRSSSLSHEILMRRSSSTESDAKIALHKQLSIEQDETMALLTAFKSVCTSGSALLSKIITFYKISLILKTNCENILKSDKAELLTALLNGDYIRNWVLIKDFVSAIGMDDNIVATIVSKRIVKLSHTPAPSISVDRHSQCCGKDLGSNSADTSVMVLQLAEILENPSVLGKCLLESIGLYNNVPDDLIVDVELCICSHHCYTLACHVGGITATLQMAKQLSQQLASVGEYTLMMRLLIGMGRFSEMSYIFDIVKSQKVNLLIEKGLETIPEYKLALLDYIKRFHPRDTDLLTMVALHFRMYREIAVTLENMAKSSLKNLTWDIAGKLIGSPKALEVTMQFFVDAADSYMQGECLQQSLTCAKQADLIALQIYLLSFDKKVLHLNRQEVTSFIANNNRFFESHIVAEAYGHQLDWALALYNNYVLKADENYLQHFCSRIQLSVPLLEEVIRRYKQESEKLEKTVSVIKRVLNMIDDVQLKYELANELGFSDVSETILEDQSYVLLGNQLAL